MMFGTQKLAPMLRRARNAFLSESGIDLDGDESDTRDDDEEEDSVGDEEEGEGVDGLRRRDPKRDVRVLVKMLEIDVSLIFVSDQVSIL